MTAVVSATTMKLRFPEFRDRPDSEIEFAIEEAAIHVDTSTASKWGNAANLALSNLAAHYLMVSIQRSESGTGQVVQSERIGEISMTYMAQKQPERADPSDLTTTPYGARYLDLCATYFPAVAII